MDETPGVRGDKAKITCGNCGRELESKGNPTNVVPFQRVPASCSDCSTRGAVVHNRFGYIARVTGDFTLSER